MDLIAKPLPLFQFLFIFTLLRLDSESKTVDQSTKGLPNQGPPDDSVSSSFKRLIQLRPNEPAKWMEEKEINDEIISNHIGYIDLTHEALEGRMNMANIPRDPSLPPIPSNFTIPPVQFKDSLFPSPEWPSSPRYSDLIKTAIKKLNQYQMCRFVKTMSDFHSRYAWKNSGWTPNPEHYLLEKVNFILKSHPQVKSSTLQVPFTDLGPQGRADQQNLIVKLEGMDSLLKDQIIILGAHQDTVNKDSKKTRAPGADDNATGMTVVLETLRVLLESGFVPKRSVEFHWYMGEERGLIGSNMLAHSYYNKRKNVGAMLNIDLVGYQSKEEKVIGIYTDFVDKNLTRFIEMLATTFLDYQWKNKECKYFCSDHVSWARNGYASSFVSEVNWNPDIHTERDTIEKVNFEQVNEVAKLAVAFVVEAAEPNNK